MNAKTLLLVCAPLLGAHPQDVELALQDISYQLQCHKVEIDLLHEKLQKLTRLEQKHQQLASDIASLKSQIAALPTSNPDLEKSLQQILTLLEEPTKTYKVQPGDTLGKIALHHKTTTQKLKKANNLSSDTIRPGQILKIN